MCPPKNSSPIACFVLQFDGSEFLAQVSHATGPSEFETRRFGGLRQLAGLPGQEIKKGQKLLPGIFRQRFNFGDDGIAAHGERINQFLNESKPVFASVPGFGSGLSGNGATRFPRCAFPCRHWPQDCAPAALATLWPMPPPPGRAYAVRNQFRHRPYF